MSFKMDNMIDYGILEEGGVVTRKYKDIDRQAIYNQFNGEWKPMQKTTSNDDNTTGTRLLQDKDTNQDTATNSTDTQKTEPTSTDTKVDNNTSNNNTTTTETKTDTAQVKQPQKFNIDEILDR